MNKFQKYLEKMRQILLYVFALLFILVKVKNANSAISSLTLYSSSSPSGESVTFRQTHSNTACASTMLGSINSACYMGAWLYVTNATYAVPLVDRNNNQTCSQTVTPSSTSVYRLSPLDTLTKGIVFWSGSVPTNYTLITDKIAEANINVIMNLSSSLIVTFGTSSWTLFEGINFVGRSACITSSNVVHSVAPYDLGLATVSSVVKGCDLRSDYLNLLRETFY